VLGWFKKISQYIFDQLVDGEGGKLMESKVEMTAIDSHAHMVHEGFIEDVRAGKFGPMLSIEQGPKCEMLVTKSTVLSEKRVHRSVLPREMFDVELRLQHMNATGVERQILSVLPPCLNYTLDAKNGGLLQRWFHRDCQEDAAAIFLYGDCSSPGSQGCCWGIRA
jgi:hypothetical protein